MKNIIKSGHLKLTDGAYFRRGNYYLCGSIAKTLPGFRGGPRQPELVIRLKKPKKKAFRFYVLACGETQLVWSKFRKPKYPVMGISHDKWQYMYSHLNYDLLRLLPNRTNGKTYGPFYARLERVKG